MTYNEIIQKPGKKIKKHVYYIKNNTTINVDDENVEKVKFNTQTPLVGTSITGCEITLKEKIDSAIYVQIEAKYGSDTATKTYGPFTLKEEPKYDGSAKTYLHYTYDSMLRSMVDYKPISITYPCTLYQFFSQLITELGYTNNIASLPNGARQLTEDIFDGIGFTYRGVLDDIAYANGVLFYIDENEIKIATLGGDSITINDDILKNKNIDFNEHYGPINTIVLSRSSETDTIYTEDAQSVAQNGRCEFRITDNELMNNNDRADYLPALLTQLNGIEYDIYDVELTGWGELRPLQSVVFSTNNKTYNSYIFNNEIIHTAGYKQAIYNDMPIQSEIDYKYISNDDRQQNQAYILINKKIGDVDIRGKTINLTADNIEISSTKFKVDNNGNVIANSFSSNNATITGGSLNIQDNGKDYAEKIKITDTNYSNMYLKLFSDSIEMHNNYGDLLEFDAGQLVMTGNDSGINITTVLGLGGISVGPTAGTDYFSASSNGVKANNIACGTCTLTSSSDTSVSFGKTFPNTPRVVLTPRTSSTGVIAPKLRSVSTTGFTATIGGSGFNNIDCDWIAISS